MRANRGLVVKRGMVLCVGLFVGVVVWLGVCGAASAVAAPAWRVDAQSDTTVAAGGRLDYLVQVTNVGEDPAVARLTVTLPAGVTVAPNVLSTPSFGAVAPNIPVLVSCSPADPSRCELLQLLRRLAARPATVGAG